MSFLAKPLGWLLTWTYDFIGNYGIALVILTAAVKFALYPLYKKQILSMSRMAEVAPKMTEIQRKYANDRQLQQQKMMELQKEEGYNPMAGCLPMIVQMIVIFGLFALLRNPIQFMGDSSGMIFAVHESFLWIQDLSQPDKWILPIAAGVATYFSFTMTQKAQGGDAANAAMGGAQGMMKSMKYIFPVMIVLMARSYPAGLAIYWFFGQVIQIFFNLRFNALKKKLKEEREKKKGKKK